MSARSDSAGCPFCPPAQRIFLASERWIVMRHVDPVPIAGWMMLATKAHRSGLDVMTVIEQRELGAIMSALAESVRAVTKCERTYTISFNEAVQHLHLHTIPRHAEDASTKSWALADRYRSTAAGLMPPCDNDQADDVAQRVAIHALTKLSALGFAMPMPTIV